jgi:hypothetical protein
LEALFSKSVAVRRRIKEYRNDAKLGAGAMQDSLSSNQNTGLPQQFGRDQETDASIAAQLTLEQNEESQGANLRPLHALSIGLLSLDTAQVASERSAQSAGSETPPPRTRKNSFEKPGGARIWSYPFIDEPRDAPTLRGAEDLKVLLGLDLDATPASHYGLENR